MKVVLTPEFSKWIARLKDRDGAASIAKRIVRLRNGNLGDVKSLGDGLEEMRVHYGPGYRVYFTRRGDTIAVLLTGGPKKSQDRDIVRARTMLFELDWSTYD